MNRRLRAALCKLESTSVLDDEVRARAERLQYQHFGGVALSYYDADLLQLQDSVGMVPAHYKEAIELANLVLAEVIAGVALSQARLNLPDLSRDLP